MMAIDLSNWKIMMVLDKMLKRCYLSVSGKLLQSYFVDSDWDDPASDSNAPCNFSDSFST